jgi:hypothetical protein
MTIVAEESNDMASVMEKEKPKEDKEGKEGEEEKKEECNKPYYEVFKKEGAFKMLVKASYSALQGYTNVGVRTMISSSISLAMATDMCHLFKEEELLKIM